MEEITSKLYASNNIRWRHARTLDVVQNFQLENTNLKKKVKEYESKLKECESKLKDKENIIIESTKDLSLAREKFLILEENFKKLKDTELAKEKEIKFKEHQHLKMNQKDLEYKIEDLIRENELSKREMMEYKDSMVVLKLEVQELIDSNKNKMDENTELSNRLKQKEEEMDVLNKKFEEKNININRLESNLKLAENSYQELSNSLKNENKEHEEHDEILLQYRKETEELNLELENAQRSNSELIAERKLLENKFNSEIAHLENEFYKVQQDLTKERSISRHMEEGYLESKDRYEKHIEDLDNKLTNLSKHLANRSHFAEFVGLKHENRHLATRLDEMKYKHQSLKKHAAVRIKNAEHEATQSTMKVVKKANWKSSITTKPVALLRRKSSVGSLTKSIINSNINSNYQHIENSAAYLQGAYDYDDQLDGNCSVISNLTDA